MLQRDPYFEQRQALEALEQQLTLRLRNRDGLAVEREADETDALQATLDSEAELANLNRATQLRARVHAALESLDEGEYGVCASCGKSIAPARLAALPWAANCVACEEVRERAVAARVRLSARRGPWEL